MKMKILLILLNLLPGLTLGEIRPESIEHRLDEMVKGGVISAEAALVTKVKWSEYSGELNSSRAPAGDKEEVKQYLGKDFNQLQIKQIENDIHFLLKED
jgi:hypothetical protein